jgi:hypothetical protein
MNRSSFLYTLCFVLAIGAISLATPARANLIINGSFETPTLVASPDRGIGWDVFASISGWTTVSGPGIEVGWYSLYGISGQIGTQVCELDSHNTDSNPAANTRIRQSIPTIPGRSYTLTFRTALRPGTSAASNQVNVSWNGAALDTINPTWTHMQQHSYTVVATSVSTDLDFAAGGTSDSGGSMLDDVTLDLNPYDLCLLYDPMKLHKSGSTIPIKLQLCLEGVNVSSRSIVLHAFEIVKVDDVVMGTPEDSGNANPDNDFRYDATLGNTGGYIFNLSTRGLASGTYALRFEVVGESHIYEVEFQIR